MQTHFSAYLQRAAPLLLLAGPAMAQDATAEAVGTGFGLIIGLVIAIVIGAVIGWIAGMIVGGSSGFWTNVIVGIVGSILAGWGLQLIGIVPQTIVGSLLASVAGAVVLLLIVRAIRR